MISTIVIDPMALLAAWGVVAVGVLATLSAMMAGDAESLDAERHRVPATRREHGLHRAPTPAPGASRPDPAASR